ncbi:NAD(P)-dependent dehydrogenase (short-subunit alcohol dehydrogenase family) [Rhodoferax ferrireducens]|uniref:NAD(P)-dependent dehydrogenase (Short-subunit alcohol dehydrogenase family) n=1 Tax=Rhodoferax ferrireducens TaxID=192843 RepID=A0ABU2CC45_9BURK|nr:SDR family NAD(P)-dependent oxidoreductase [Rhodoferax ferrireducens]MDR7378874.1 NAD(P)-dependent dehydrogenase (short-subunit alcohol dehydrogenase family) [Rhodoferax ferrireducens]
MSFQNHTVMLTGAAGNLGQAVAAAFAAQGARLVLLDRRLDALQHSFGDTGPDRLLLATDLLDPGQIAAALAAAEARFGRIHVLCNLAGGFRMGEAVHATSDSTWDLLFDTNARTLLNMARSLVPHMLAQGGGKIVNVGAFAAQKGVAQMGAYCASKSSVIRLTEAMAAELREQNINVNCVLPTILDSPENRAAMPDADPARWVKLDDLAQVIVFLASDAARAVHGAALPVTGLS